MIGSQAEAELMPFQGQYLPYALTLHAPSFGHVDRQCLDSLTAMGDLDVPHHSKNSMVFSHATLLTAAVYTVTRACLSHNPGSF